MVLERLRAYGGRVSHIVDVGHRDGRWAPALCGFTPQRPGEQRSGSRPIGPWAFRPDGWRGDKVEIVPECANCRAPATAKENHE